MEPEIGAAAPGSGVGELLRFWRNRTGLSQLDVSGQTGVSTRHLSYVETGKARPSREMLLRLAAHLDVPLRERNRLLLAAGYAPAYQRTPLDHPRLGPTREILTRLLDAHQPYPALVITSSWELVQANRAFWWLLEDLPDHLLRTPVNVMRVALHPDGLITRARHPSAWRRQLYGRLRRAAAATTDPDLIALQHEIAGYPIIEPSVSREPLTDEPVATIRLRHRGHELNFLSLVATFGTPLDITPAELIIESLYPADTQTAVALHQHCPARTETPVPAALPDVANSTA